MRFNYLNYLDAETELGKLVDLCDVRYGHEVYEYVECLQAEIGRLRVLLEKYTWEINRFGEHSASDDLPPTTPT